MKEEVFNRQIEINYSLLFFQNEPMHKFVPASFIDALKRYKRLSKVLDRSLVKKLFYLQL